MPHCFMGINQSGQVCLLQTQGNPDGHIILRRKSQIIMRKILQIVKYRCAMLIYYPL